MRTSTKSKKKRIRSNTDTSNAGRRSERLRKRRRRSEENIVDTANSIKTWRVWTDEDVQKLRDLRASGKSYEEIGKLLDRSVGAVHNKCKMLKITKMNTLNDTDDTTPYRKWTDEEEQKLRDMSASGKSFEEIGNVIHRSESAVSNRYYKLKLQKLK